MARRRPDGFRNWLSRGLIPKKQVKGWIAELGDRLAEVDLEGETAYLPSEHLDELATTKPSSSVRFLGGFDQWVLGPGHGRSARHRLARDGPT